MPVTVQDQAETSNTALVIHGGAGSMSADEMSEEKQRMCRAALRSALRRGKEVLQNGGSAVDAIEVAIATMEHGTLFNAGRGAVLTSDDTVELGASVMDGETRNAGALTGVKTVKHPIRLARSIMEESDHVMIAHEGAETFARDQGLETVENEYFVTESRRSSSGSGGPSADPSRAEFEKLGTVGAVALDVEGNLAAGTSTGGISDQHPGRVGDSPIIGGGTYASNQSCAVSATGQGEFFMRGVATHRVASRVRFGGEPLPEAAWSTIKEIEEMGGVGGVIGLDRDGNIATPFSTSGMFRAYHDRDGETTVRIFEQDHGT